MGLRYATNADVCARIRAVGARAPSNVWLFSPSIWNPKETTGVSVQRAAVLARPVSLATDILTCCSAAATAAESWQPARKPAPPQLPHPLAHNLTFDLPPALSYPLLTSQLKILVGF